MANRRDSEGCVVLSMPQSGLNREFVYSLKSQLDGSDSFIRSRARKLPDNPNCVDELVTFSNKRLKCYLNKEEKEVIINDIEKNPIKEETLKIVDKSSVNEETLSISLDILKNGASKSDRVDLRSEGTIMDHRLKCRDGEEGKSDLGKSSSVEEMKTNVETPKIIDGDLTNVAVAESTRIFPGSNLKGMEEQLKVEDNSEVHDTLLEKSKRQLARSSMEPKGEKMVVDDGGEVENAIMEESAMRFSHSESESEANAEDMVLDDNKEVKPIPISESPIKMITSSVTEQEEEKPLEKPTISNVVPEDDMVLTTEKLKEPNHLAEKTMKRARVALETMTESAETSKNCGKHNIYLEKSTARFTHTHLEPEVKRAAVSESCFGQNGSLEKPMKRSRLLTEIKAESLVIDCNGEVQNSISVEAPRRLTRSALKLKKEKMNTNVENQEATRNEEFSPLNSSTICVNCKGPVPVDTKRSVPICNSCLESRNHYSNPANRTSTNLRSKSGLSPQALRDLSSQDRSVQGKLTKKDLGLHKLVFEEGGLPDGAELTYMNRGQRMLEGYKKGSGIFCRCCSSEVSPSQFESHAGFRTRRKPYDNIFTSIGVSLHELSLSLSKGRKLSANYSDDLCGICENSGDLLCCSGCPRAFHKVCVGLSSTPEGKWYCSCCENMFRREGIGASNANAVAAGRVDGIDPIEEISKRCIRIVETFESEVVGGCTLCRCQDFSKSVFDSRTVIICDQCEKEYHVGCLKDNNMADLKELPQGSWFCSAECYTILTKLYKSIKGGSQKLPTNILSSIKKKREEKGLIDDADHDIKWTLLSGKRHCPESKSLLHEALAIFHDTFDPIVDGLGGDLIPPMLYGGNRNDQDFRGMYCVVLTVNSSVVSAGLLRVFGTEVAELPLVATSKEYQGQGYFEALFSCIERYLWFLNVKKIVVPAAGEAESLWTNKFGFIKMSSDQVKECRKHCQVTLFQGTSMLHKVVPRCQITIKTVAKS